MGWRAAGALDPGVSDVSESDDIPVSRRLRFLAERTPDAGPPLPDALVAVFDALERWRRSAPIRYAGFPGRPIERDPANISRYLAAVQRTEQAGEIAPVRFSSDERAARLDVFAGEDRRCFGAVQTVWLTLPSAGPALELGAIMQMAAEVCVAFGAHEGRLEDERALTAIYGSSARQRAAAQLPEALLEYLPDPTAGQPSLGIELLPPTQIDTRVVPAGIGWVSVWSQRQVEELGRARVEHAQWARVAPADGFLVLALTPHPTNIDDPPDAQRLREVLEALDLAAVQRRHRCT